MAENNTSNKKSRYWSFVIYPESLPENWKDLLTDTHIKLCVSPLHDKDINPTGELKKPHYHVLLVFDGPTTYNRVNSISQLLNGTICQVVSNVGGLYRYFTHKDNPEKAQYKECDILSFNGFNIIDYDILSNSDYFLIRDNIFSIIYQENIIEYSCLIDFLRKHQDVYFYEYDFACKNSYLFDKYLTSRRFVYMQGLSNKTENEKVFSFDLDKRLKEK